MKNSFRPSWRDRGVATISVSFALYRASSLVRVRQQATFCAWRTSPASAIWLMPPDPRHRARRDALRETRHGGRKPGTVVTSRRSDARRVGGRRLAGRGLRLVAKRADSVLFD